MAPVPALLEQTPPILRLRPTLLGYVALNAAHVLSLGKFMVAVVALALGIQKAPGLGCSANVAGPLQRMAIATGCVSY